MILPRYGYQRLVECNYRFSILLWPHAFQRAVGSDLIVVLPLTCPPKSSPVINSHTGYSREVEQMPRKGSAPEQIIGKLREVDVLVQQGQAVREAGQHIYLLTPSSYLIESKSIAHEYRSFWCRLRNMYGDTDTRRYRLSRSNGKIHKTGPSGSSPHTKITSDLSGRGASHCRWLPTGRIKATIRGAEEIAPKEPFGSLVTPGL